MRHVSSVLLPSCLTERHLELRFTKPGSSSRTLVYFHAHLSGNCIAIQLYMLLSMLFCFFFVCLNVSYGIRHTGVTGFLQGRSTTESVAERLELLFLSAGSYKCT